MCRYVDVTFEGGSNGRSVGSVAIIIAPMERTVDGDDDRVSPAIVIDYRGKNVKRRRPQEEEEGEEEEGEKEEEEEEEEEQHLVPYDILRESRTSIGVFQSRDERWRLNPMKSTHVRDGYGRRRCQT